MKTGLRMALLTAGVMSAAIGVARGQSLAYNSGQNVAPGYEGWEEDADGTKYFLFGYMNRNWQEEIDVPVGPDNGFAPGAPDQGQPTHFLPRRNRFVFRVKVPANFGAKDELVWTLTTHGVTEKAYASLREDYKVDDVVKASETGALGAGSSSPEIRANKPPSVKIDGPKTYTVKAGESLKLAAIVTDDGVPKRRAGGFSGAAVSRRSAEGANATPGAAGGAAPANGTGAAAGRQGAGAGGNTSQPTPFRNAATLPPVRVTVGKNIGLHLSWFEYRGPAGAKVSFDPAQIKPWEDTRAGANSPWAPIWTPPEMPADGKIPVTVSFSEPGTYVLRALADDGALTGGEDVTVTVTK